ncbi:MAG: NHLP leader peptide family natural product precursor, partial [Candidatus Atribacteria bacterium]|nr:NHLP leader peptide family natural product precursor [Candidatus Atribacteria bacterium]
LLGKELPAGQTIQFIENLPGMDQTFILPPYQGELSREELKKVTGGGEHTDCGMGAYANCGMGLS